MGESSGFPDVDIARDFFLCSCGILLFRCWLRFCIILREKRCHRLERSFCCTVNGNLDVLMLAWHMNLRDGCKYQGDARQPQLEPRHQPYTISYAREKGSDVWFSGGSGGGGSIATSAATPREEAFVAPLMRRLVAPKTFDGFVLQLRSIRAP